MADDSIVSRATMQKRGAADFKAGKARADHAMNPWAPALEDWFLGYDRAADEHYHPMRKESHVDVAQAVQP